MRNSQSHDFLFYSQALTAGSQAFELSGEEHHHLHNVLRIAAGETVFVTNGRGLIVACTVGGSADGATELAVDDVITDVSSKPKVTLALGCLKKDAFETAVKQCTELGVGCIIPVAFEKSHLKTYSPNFVERLNRIALSAVKQSFQPLVPELAGVHSFEALLEALPAFDRVIVGDAYAPAFAGDTADGLVLMVVGPEGGLTDSERERLLASGGVLVSGSPHRLPSETAAVVLSALVLHTRENS